MKNKIKIIGMLMGVVLSKTAGAVDRQFENGQWGTCGGLIYSASEYNYPENMMQIGEGSILVDAVSVAECKDQFGNIVATNLCEFDIAQAPKKEQKSPAGSINENVIDEADGIVGYRQIYFAEGENIGTPGPATCDSDRLYIQSSSNPIMCEKSFYVASYDDSLEPLACSGVSSISAPLISGSCKLNGTNLFVDDSNCPSSSLVEKTSPAGLASLSISNGSEVRQCDEGQTSGIVQSRSCDASFYDFDGGCNQFLKVVSRSNHSCAISSTGGAYCWGNNNTGQLGDNTNNYSLIPVRVLGLSSGVSKIATGTAHTCALHNNVVKCWGENWYGQLGDNTGVDSKIPVLTQGLSNISELYAGSNHTCAIDNGAAKCWGDNVSGQLGNNSTVKSLAPVFVQGLTANITNMDTGFRHTCAVENGAAKCWGANYRGQLGNNSTLQSLVPVSVFGLTSGVSKISIADSHTCAIHNGAAKCWGGNVLGQLGNNSTTDSSVPVDVSGLATGVSDMSGGSNHTCAIQSGFVKCWGRNSEGQIGNSGGNSPIPVIVSGISTANQISLGYNFSCAIDSGTVKCWGSNMTGYLGNNSLVDSFSPVNLYINHLKL